jgi:hypothetical protein
MSFLHSLKAEGGPPWSRETPENFAAADYSFDLI